MNIPIKVNIKKPYQIGSVGTSTGGTGEIPDNSIGSEKLKDGAVTPEKLDRKYIELNNFTSYAMAVESRLDALDSNVSEIDYAKIANPILSPTLDDIGKILQLKLEGNKVYWSAEFVE